MMIEQLKRKDWNVFREKYGIDFGLVGLFIVGAMATGITIPTADGLVEHLIRWIPIVVVPGSYVVSRYYFYRQRDVSK